MSRTPLLALVTAALVSLAAIAPGLAATGNPREATVTFAVANMTCPLCPITVRKAMGAVHGVRTVEVDLSSRTAIVTYDAQATTPGVIAAASRDAGYPAVPK